MAEDKAAEVFAVGEMVEWVEDDGTIWDVEVLEVKSYGVLVDSGYGKKALFAPNSEDPSKHTRLVGEMEMEEYIRHPKKEAKKGRKIEATKSEKAPETFVVGETVEWVEEDGTIWDVEVLEVRNYGVVVSYSWDKALFAPSAVTPGKLTRWVGGKELKDYIQHPETKKDTKAKTGRKGLFRKA
jgi:hypothetical protein